MPYKDLSDEMLVTLAHQIPLRPQCVALHDYITNVRSLVNGTDTINIPETHRKLLRGENHEGSVALNRRIRQLASWFSHADIRFSVQASGPGDVVQRGSTLQERFVFRAEKELGKGSGLHRWKQQSHRDLAECGIAVLQQNPKREFYMEVEKTPQLMAAGSLLTDVIWRRRVDPITYSWQEDEEGQINADVITATRHLGEIARMSGLAEAQKVLGYFDFGENLDPDDPDSWDPDVQISTAEVWGGNNGGIILLGAGKQATPGFGNAVGEDLVLARWRHTNDRPPHYIAAPSTWPFHSPLDEMIQFTNERNFWATMLDLQASGAIFRHWQLVDVNKGGEVFLQRDAVPEHLKYDLSKPPPDMGEGTRWELAPFEWQDCSARYDQIRAEHELAGASVARLVGQQVSSSTPVGTADMMNDSALQEFAEWIECLQDSRQEMWQDYFRWHRNVHKDPITVFDMKRDIEGPKVGAFINTTLSLKASDIVSEALEVRYDTRNRIQKAADFRFALEMISAGMMDYDRAVNMGLIPDVDDPDAEKLAIYISEAERIEVQVELEALKHKAAEALGLLQPSPQTQPRFMQGTQTDPRSLGAGQGADNVANTAMAPGATNMLRKTA